VAEIPRQPSREPSREPSQEEREFWDPRFRDEPGPKRRADAQALPRREQRLAAVADGPLTRLLDRVRDWRTDARLGVVVLVVVAVVAGVVWYRIGVGGASAGEAAGTPRAVTTTVVSAGNPAALPSTTATGSPATMAVHVAGAVTHPGVVDLRAGARVIDAIEAAGGALADGDLDRLNLAARVADGERVYVAKAGQADPGVIGDTGGVGGAGAGGSAAPGAKVNLNTASQAQLEELPGIGPTYAQSIIAERQRRGGFTSVNDLRSVRGIGDKRFAELAPLVTV
jgi:competence protein ComEA